MKLPGGQSRAEKGPGECARAPVFNVINVPRRMINRVRPDFINNTFSSAEEPLGKLNTREKKERLISSLFSRVRSPASTLGRANHSFIHRFLQWSKRVGRVTGFERTLEFHGGPVLTRKCVYEVDLDGVMFQLLEASRPN